MQVYSDRFETVLPKTGRFFSPSKPKQQKPPVWGYLAAGALIGATLFGAMMPKTQPSPAGGVIPTPVAVAPTPPAFSPLDSGAHRVFAPNAPVVEVLPPRAKLVHLRPIGTYQNALMPDGRILNSLYKGELPSAASLPRSGSQLGDMWYTRNDGHTWVLAPVTAGSQTMGWVDP